jgi:putative transposase
MDREPFHRFHSDRLRKGRVSIPCQLYLVTAVTHDRRPFFADFTLGRIVVRALRHLAEKGSVESVAFVVMPDHLHWLLSLNAEVALSAVMKSIKGYSAHEITNIVVSRSDSSGRGVVNRVWQNGFHDHALRKDEEVDAVARYLVMNPVRAGIVADIWQYPLWDAIWVGES